MIADSSFVFLLNSKYNLLVTLTILDTPSLGIAQSILSVLKSLELNPHFLSFVFIESIRLSFYCLAGQTPQRH
jgi:hypothetical protein